MTILNQDVPRPWVHHPFHMCHENLILMDRLVKPISCFATSLGMFYTPPSKFELMLTKYMTPPPALCDSNQCFSSSPSLGSPPLSILVTKHEYLWGEVNPK